MVINAKDYDIPEKIITEYHHTKYVKEGDKYKKVITKFQTVHRLENGF